MWLFTTKGFYSIVEGDNSDTLVVRARVRKDLENITEFFPKGTQILRYQQSDYRYRMIVPRKNVSDFLVSMANEIDYRNFKNQVMEVQGIERESIYLRVWSSCLALETLDHRDAEVDRFHP